MAKAKEERKGQTHRESLTRWSDSHVLLAVHDEAPHRLAIWIVGSSLTYCGWRRRQKEGGIGGRGQSGQLVLLIKAQWPKQDHLLAGARTESRCCVLTSFCSVSVKLALHCKLLVDFNASKCSNRDRTERVQHTLLFPKVRFEPSGEGDNCFIMKTNKTCSHD